MHRTLHAHDSLWLRSVVILAALAPAAVAQIPDSGRLLLDLTKPVPIDEQLNVLPGASVGGVGGQALPKGYPLPLAVDLKNISPRPVKLGDKFKVEVVLRNTGNSTFILPSSQNSAKVLKQGNKGRRTFLFFLVFEDPNSGRQISHIMASTQGCDTVPTSWLLVEPAQAVRVLFKADLDRIADWLKADVEQVRVRAQVSEWKYEDTRFFIENRAEPVLSDNTITLKLAPPNRGVSHGQ